MPIAYEEFVDFIAAGTTPASLVDFQPSAAAKSQVLELLGKQKAGTLTPDEVAELNHFLEIEHIMRLAKARARQYLQPKN